MSHPDRSYLQIVSACEADLDVYGDTYRGVGWTKRPEYAALRYEVMLGLIDRDSSGAVELLDVGCGASHLLEHIRVRGLTRIKYTGLDLSSKFLALSRKKFPEITYYQVDLLDDSVSLPQFDYLVMNGLFNYRGSLSYDEMWRYCQAFLIRAAAHSSRGFAFNVMSTYVDWERDDLFHLPLETMSAFVTEQFGRNFVVRHDYGLFEYTVYVYRTSLADLLYPSASG